MKDERRRNLIARPAHHYAILLSVAALAVLSVGALYVLMALQIGDMASRVLAVDDVVSSRKFDQSRAKEIQRVFEATAGDRAEARSLFVPSDGVISFIESIERVGSSTGASVSVSSIQADDLTLADPGTVGSIQARVDARGSWASVMRALSLIEDSRYAVSISSVKLFSSRSGGPAQGMASAAAVWSLSIDLGALSIASSQHNQ